MTICPPTAYHPARQPDRGSFGAEVHCTIADASSPLGRARNHTHPRQARTDLHIIVLGATAVARRPMPLVKHRAAFRGTAAKCGLQRRATTRTKGVFRPAVSRQIPDPGLTAGFLGIQPLGGPGFSFLRQKAAVVKANLAGLRFRTPGLCARCGT